jgi:hypothetical protein
MLTNLKIIFLITVFSLAVGVNYVRAADLNFTDNTNIALGVGTFVIQAGSVATSVVVGGTNNTTLAITVPISGTLTLISPDKYILTNDQNLTQNCTSSQNSVVVIGGTTVTFTPSSTICTVTAPAPAISSTGTTSAGSLPTYGCKDPKATNYNYFSTSDPALCKYATSTTIRTSVKTSSSKTTTPSKLTQTLKLGSKGNQVTSLQTLLKKLGFLSTKPDGIFGKATLKALEAFQVKYKIAKFGVVGYGQVGPNTRKELNQINQ